MGYFQLSSEAGAVNNSCINWLCNPASADGLLDMTSGGSASSSRRASLTREVDFGTACRTCRRSCAPARLNATCRCPSSAGRPTRYPAHSRTTRFIIIGCPSVLTWRLPVWQGALEARDYYVPNPSCKEFNKYEWIGQLMGAALRGKDFLVSHAHS